MKKRAFAILLLLGVALAACTPAVPDALPVDSGFISESEPNTNDEIETMSEATDELIHDISVCIRDIGTVLSAIA